MPADGTPAPKPLLGLDASYWFKIIEAAIMCVTALLIGLFVARPLIGRMFAPNPPSQAQPSPAQRHLAGRRRAAGARPRPARRPPKRPGTAQDSARAQPGIDLSQIEGQVREFLRQEDRRSGERPS